MDALTQLPDYAFTETYLADRLKFASEHVIPFGLLCIQLDQLETLTATHGLDAAEAILSVVAHTLRNGLDPMDFVGRWSEDQFLAIVANCSESDLLTTAERLKRLAQSSEIEWWGDQLSVTAVRRPLCLTRLRVWQKSRGRGGKFFHFKDPPLF